MSTPVSPRTSDNRRSLAHHLLTAAIAVACALGVWTAMLPWSSLTEVSGHSGPVLWCVLLVAAGSSLVRATGVGGWVALPLGFLLGTAVPLALVDAPPFPTPAGVRALASALADDLDAVGRYAVPLSAEGGDLALLFTLVALGAILLLDLFVVGGGRVVLGGLVLLVLHLVPSNLGPEATWSQFAATAAWFVVLLLLVRARENLRWELVTQSHSADAGSDAGSGAGLTRESGQRSLLAAGLPTAVVVSTATIAVSCLVAAHLPLPSRGTDGSGRGKGSDEVTVANPLVDLRRDLSRGRDVDLLIVETEGGTPQYVRTSVLTQYDGKQWSTGERESSADQTADGNELPPVPGLDAWSNELLLFNASDAFHSRWLPLPEQVLSVIAEGEWRYDTLTRDFVSWKDGLDTTGASWSAVAAIPEVEAEELDSARTGMPPGGRFWTRLPSDLPPLVRELATEVTSESDTPLRKARALQAWFRSDFEYSLEQVESVGDDDLVAFLSPEGRVGYCEQFAASMALMARSLGIPARVAVGFLEPERIGEESYVFSSHDLHAWPELYFEGAGWLRFEPTPGSRTPEPPQWSTDPLPGESTAPRPSASARPSAKPSAKPSPSARPSATPRPGGGATGRDQGSFVDARVLGWTAGVLVVMGAAAAPALIRRRRRADRLAGDDAEQWWSELRDIVLDLGGSWPAGRSPRQNADAVRVFDPATDDAALGRLVAVLEVSRYAPAGTVAEGSPADGAALVDPLRDSLFAHRSRAARLRATLLPRSLFRRRA
ncbi:transglutaminaseTgpA domain-containing protein [Nocardioides yefusunii]|uniref:TransglutaminaseTgpA domain-containing protein n=1 Tax=Nocardioides yefusunii TaxID=2500546 RepID=A0ABW1QUV6_9ACTN|nr:DUF3488 and transglutaminase-like domain-containing protein [Nocardioides yefusunii]